jgi:hypothetical protein
MALVHGDVDLVLPYVPEAMEAEVRAAFARAMHVRELDPVAREVGELHFFETVVRLHREGEGAPFTGLKPMGLDVGPVIGLAEEAADSGNAEALVAELHRELDSALIHRLAEVVALGRARSDSVASARRYVSAFLGFQRWAHHVHEALAAGDDHRTLEVA